MAQDSREALIAAEQADKATRLAPRAPSTADKMLRPVRGALLETEPTGLYPYFDSAYSGGGFTLGVGYAQFMGDRARWNVVGLYSVKAYKRVEANVTAPGHFTGRLDLRARVGWRDATQVAYHGLGIDSPEELDVGFRMQQGYAGGDVTLRPERWLLFRTGVSLEDYTIKDPTGDLISVKDVHTEATAPGIGINPFYVHTAASVGIDTRPAVDYARRGGLYELAFHHYGDADSTYTFGRLEARIVQHIPIFHENWVISLRGQLQSINRRQRSGAVLPDALPRKRQHPARVSQLALPRSACSGRLRRVQVDTRPPGARHGVVL